MRSKKKSKSRRTPKEMHICQWCLCEKAVSHFYKCSIINHTNICKKCIEEKFDSLLKVCSKEKALFICCHYLNIAYFSEIANSFDPAQRLGYYIRTLNLHQNQCPEDFEQGILNGYSECFAPIDNITMLNTKKRLTEVIRQLEGIINEIQ